MDSLKIQILEDHKSHYLERLLNRNPLLRFKPTSSRLDITEIFTDIPRGAIAKLGNVSLLKTVLEPERLLECLLNGEKVLIRGITPKIIPKLYKIGINAKELSRISGQHALFIGYPILEIVQANEKSPIYAPLYLIPIKEDGLGAKNGDLLIEPFINVADRAEIKPNIILKQWILSKYDENIGFNIEKACDILKYGDQSIEIDFQDSLNVCFSDWKDVDNRSINIVGLIPSNQVNSTVGVRVVNSAILGVADFKGQSVLADIDEAIKLITIASDSLGVMNCFLEPIKEVSENSIEEPLEKNKFLVCNSDPSQEKVIWKVRDSNLTVIQGPPGTGKSQTIVNMISDALAMKQRVAVFSQKKAALDVIYKRAHRDGFGDLCLLLEDAHKQRKVVIESIKNTKNPESIGFPIETTRNAVASNLKHSEDAVDTLTLPYIKQSDIPYRYADILSRQQTLGLKDYSKSSAWEELIKQITIHKSELSDEKRNIQILVSELVNVDYASSVWRHYRLNKIHLHEIEVAELKLLTILRFYEKGIFIPKNVAKRSKWLLTSPYFDTHSNLFGVHDIGVDHQILADAVVFFYDALDNHSYQYHDVLSGKVDVGVYQLLLNQIGQSYNVIELKKKIFDNSVYKVLGEGYLDQISDWEKILELAYLEGYRRSLMQRFPLAYRSVTDISMQKKILQDNLIKKRNMDQEWIRLSFNEKDHAVNSLNFKDSLRLRGNARTKTRKTEIRDLFSNRNFDDLTRIYPVVLCNPETACAVFPLETGIFDLVIIDEASQMYVAEALPLLLRGKRVVIAGDSKQMPPSDFFSSVSNEEDWLDDDSFDDNESTNDVINNKPYGIPAHGEFCLLDVAEIAVKGNNGQRLLEIHYRSASSELIEFSNHAFYEGKLQCPPSNPRLNSLFKTPIVFKQVSGQFNKGENEVEARTIVEYLRKIWSSPNPPTCGVIVFNVKQQAYIERLLEELSLNDPEFMVMFEEQRSRSEDGEDVGFFVRSVEHVQGDERDLIILGSTYSGNSKRFGPLSKANKGRRRLNVAITRSKKAMIVLTSLNQRSIGSSSGDEIEDADYMFLFLAYARAVSEGDKDAIERVLNQVNSKRHHSVNFHKYDSPFEEEVANFLMQNRYEVDSQVGEGGFRIDLAVKNPNGMGYLYGIECDGATYHSGWKARFNDVWRQSILESKGWHIIRIWSTDWYHNKQNTQAEIIKQLESVNDVGDISSLLEI